jgi:citrate synthase
MMNAMAQSILALYVLDEQADDVSLPNVMRQCLKLIATFPLLAAYSYQAYSYRHRQEPGDPYAPARAVHRRELPAHAAQRQPLFAARGAIAGPRPGAARRARRRQQLVVHHPRGDLQPHRHLFGHRRRHGLAEGPAPRRRQRQGRRHVRGDEAEVKDWTNDKQVEDYLNKLLKKEAFDRSGLIYGIGHAVYSTSDPRTEILRGQVEKLAAEKGVAEEMDLYLRVERLASADHRPTSARCTRASAPTWISTRASCTACWSIPKELFTPIFAMSRIAGWSAHRLEELANGGKIIRPAYKSVAARRPYVPMGKRTS